MTAKTSVFVTCVGTIINLLHNLHEFIFNMFLDGQCIDDHQDFQHKILNWSPPPPPPSLSPIQVGQTQEGRNCESCL